MYAAETGQMSAVERRQMYSIETGQPTAVGLAGGIEILPAGP